MEMKWQLKTFVACLVLQKLLCVLVRYSQRSR